MDPCADSDAGDDPGPDLSHDFPDRLQPLLHPSGETQALPLKGRLRLHGLVDPALDVPLELHPAEDEAGDDGDGEPGDEVEGRHLPSEEAEEEHQRDLVHHGRRDEE